MKINFRQMALVLAAVFASGCGTISKIQPSQAPPDRGVAQIDVKKYDTVAILDFEDETKRKPDPTSTSAAANDAQTASKYFADRIAAELRKRKLFQKVIRGPLEGDALLVHGSVVRYEEGNSSLRLWVGFGAGSSYFDATVRFSDNRSKTQLGSLIVDKNSWALGGGIAADQTVDSYMSSAAIRIASELERAYGGARNSQPSPGPDEAVVYILRKGKFAGAALAPDIKQDGVTIGEIRNGSYFFTHVPPGPHTFSSSKDSFSPRVINAEAGKVYFVQFVVKWGKLELTEIPEVEGHSLMLKLKLQYYLVINISYTFC